MKEVGNIVKNIGGFDPAGIASAFGGVAGSILKHNITKNQGIAIVALAATSLAAIAINQFE